MRVDATAVAIVGGGLWAVLVLVTTAAEVLGG